MIETVLVLPTPPALLPPGSLTDPVAELRAACAEAVDRLPDARLAVLAAPVAPANAARGITEPLGHRVAAHLLGDRPFERLTHLSGQTGASPTTLLVMADGSARRGENAPGQLHPGAAAFDDAVEQALRTGDADALAALDPAAAAELWCEGAPVLCLLGEATRGRRVATEVTYADAPWGVAWWVARWDLRTS